MFDDNQLLRYEATFDESVRRILGECKKRDRAVFDRLQKQIDKILRAPELGKPLRYHLKHCRRLHVGPFVLVYEINMQKRTVHFLEFDHHDKVYKK